MHVEIAFEPVHENMCLVLDSKIWDFCGDGVSLDIDRKVLVLRWSAVSERFNTKSEIVGGISVMLLSERLSATNDVI